MNVKLSKVAEVLKIHPRTVLRTLAGDRNAMYSEIDDQDIDLFRICKAFNVKPVQMKQVIEGRDVFVTAKEGAEITKCSVRSFWNHNHSPAVDSNSGRVVRFSRSKLMDWAFLNAIG
jgi:hypothetical protein